MEDWHRWLAVGAASRATARLELAQHHRRLVRVAAGRDKMAGSPVPERGGQRQESQRRKAGEPGGEAPVRRFDGLNRLWTQASAQTPGWQSISIRSSSLRAPVTFQIDSGAGRPDLRSQLTLDRRTGEVVKVEPFSSQTPGRQLRSWIRFTHTAEDGGVFGETLAMPATAGGAVLVFTGLLLAVRRFAAAMKRRQVVRATASSSMESLASSTR